SGGSWTPVMVTPTGVHSTSSGLAMGNTPTEDFLGISPDRNTLLHTYFNGTSWVTATWASLWGTSPPPPSCGSVAAPSGPEPQPAAPFDLRFPAVSLPLGAREIWSIMASYSAASIVPNRPTDRAREIADSNGDPNADFYSIAIQLPSGTSPAQLIYRMQQNVAAV